MTHLKPRTTIIGRDYALLHIIGAGAYVYLAANDRSYVTPGYPYLHVLLSLVPVLLWILLIRGLLPVITWRLLVAIYRMSVVGWLLGYTPSGYGRFQFVETLTSWSGIIGLPLSMVEHGFNDVLVAMVGTALYALPLILLLMDQPSKWSASRMKVSSSPGVEIAE